MSRDASGNFTLASGNPVQGGTVIEPEWANPTLEDIAAGLTDSLSRSGDGAALANISMGGFKLSALGAAALGTDAAQAAQVRNCAFSWLFPVSSDSAGNAYTGTALLPDAPVAGTVFYFLADKTNTGPMTLRVNGGAILPLQAGGSVVSAGIITPGNVVSAMFYNDTYRLLGVGAGSPSLSTVVSNSAALGGSISGTQLNLTLVTNAASGVLQLTDSNTIPVTYLPTSGDTYLGQWNAGTGTLPPSSTVQGGYYIINGAGTLTLYVPSAPNSPIYAPAATPVVEADVIIYNKVASTNNPIGWYFVDKSSVTATAATTSNIATPTFPGATNLQSWINAADPFMAAAMPKAGGLFTGQVYQSLAPSATNSLTNKQYVDDKVAALPPGGVTSFNTRTGAITLLNGDVLAALGYTPANVAGQVFTGDITVPFITAMGFKQDPYEVTLGGAVALDAVNRQSQIITLSSNLTINSINNLPNGTILRLTLILSGHTITSWPASVVWAGGFPPTWTSGVTGKALVVLEADGTGALLASGSVY